MQMECQHRQEALRKIQQVFWIHVKKHWYQAPKQMTEKKMSTNRLSPKNITIIDAASKVASMHLDFKNEIFDVKSNKLRVFGIGVKNLLSLPSLQKGDGIPQSSFRLPEIPVSLNYNDKIDPREFIQKKLEQGKEDIWRGTKIYYTVLCLICCISFALMYENNPYKKGMIISKYSELF